MSRARLCALAVALSAAALPAHADWPTFRGDPAQTGVAAGAALPERLEVLWAAKTGGAIEGTPAIAGGVVYVGSFDEHLHALSLADGTPRWKTKLAPLKAPVGVRGGAVYAGDIDGKLHAVDAATGKAKWAFETGAEITGGPNFVGDDILVGSHDQTLYRLMPDGKPRWKYAIDGPVNGSPAVAGDKTFVAGCDSILHVVDATAGKRLATVDLEGQAGASAAVAGDRLYVGTMNNQVLGIDLTKGTVLWRYEAERRRLPFYSSAAVTDKHVIIGGRDKAVVALDRETGKPAWTFLTEDKVDASPVVVGNRVYVGNTSDDGLFFVLDAATGRKLQELELGSPILGSAAVSGGRLVVGTEKGVVYCLGAK